MTNQANSVVSRPALVENAGRKNPHQSASDDPSQLSMLGWAEGVLFETTSGPPVEIRDLRVLRDGAKRLACVTLGNGTSLVLKQYADDRGAWTQRWMDRLCDAGFAPPSRFSVTPARGWSRTHSTLVADEAPQHPWTTWLTSAPRDRDAAAEAAADWLVALQAMGIALPDRTEYRAGTELTRDHRELALEFPVYSEVLQRVGREVHDRLYGLDRGTSPLVASHGDLHPNNLHIADDGRMSVMAIDVDTAGLRRPAYDVGYAVAQMLIMSWMRTGTFHVGACAAQAFVRRWEMGGAPDVDSVAAEVVRALLQSLHFELVTYRNGRTDLLDPWLYAAHLMLTTGVADTLATLATEEENAS